MSDKSQSLTVSVPGSVMLLGEHAVLRNRPAIVSAIDYRIKATLNIRDDRQIIIRSKLGEKTYNLEELSIEAPFQFILAAIQLFKSKLKTGFEINIESEFSHQVGLGSSAAVCVATVALLQKHILHHTSLRHVWELSLRAIRAVQGVGSGADAAASVYGGTIYYQQAVGMIERITSLLPIGLIYSGAKTPTAEVIQYVEKRFRDKQEELAILDEAIGRCSEEALHALRQHNWRKLGALFNKQQALMEKLGVCNDALYEILQSLNQEHQLYGAKISGSGLGDCVVYLGKLLDVQDDRYIPLKISQQGIIFYD